jgi:hypothetical protein
MDESKITYVKATITFDIASSYDDYLVSSVFELGDFDREVRINYINAVLYYAAMNDEATKIETFGKTLTLKNNYYGDYSKDTNKIVFSHQRDNNFEYGWNFEVTGPHTFETYKYVIVAIKENGSPEYNKYFGIEAFNGKTTLLKLGSTW